MGVNMVVMANASFHLEAGEAKEVSFPVVMPTSEGVYPVYLDAWSGETLLGHYKAVEDVIIVSAPLQPLLVYARPVEAQVASGGTGHINYKVGISDITTGYTLIFLFPLEGVYCWTPYGCANVDFRAGATAGYYEGSAPWYVKYLYATPYKFANIPPGTYRLLSTCELYKDGTLVKTYWSKVDTGEKITVV